MAVATTIDYISTRDQILNAILRKLTGGREPFDPSDMDIALEGLQLTVKSLQNRQVLLWTLDWATQTLTAASEVTGTDSLIYTCRRSHTGATANRPITGAEWPMYWEQTGSTGGVWAASSYTAIGEFTLSDDTVGIEKAYQRKDDLDSPIEIIPWLDYLDIAAKKQTGSPVKMAFNRNVDGLSKAFIWPQPDGTDYLIHYQKVRKLKDFDTDSDNPDFPVRWYKYLIFQTCLDLSDDFSIPERTAAKWKVDANSEFMQARRQEFERTDDSFIEPI